MVENFSSLFKSSGPSPPNEDDYQIMLDYVMDALVNHHFQMDLQRKGVTDGNFVITAGRWSWLFVV